jgi:glucose/arabinose dehydrogenase
VQCGLLDLAIDPDYANTGWVYLSYSDVDAAQNVMIAIARGRIVDNSWTDQQILFHAPADQYSSRHHNQGSRLAFDRAGYLYFSIGDQGEAENSQRLDRAAGKIHRINRDGSIPEDNPFVGNADALPSIFSLGNRNAQGLARHPVTGELWETEHGPMGGDEVNVLRSGANYGWPRTTFGLDYDGTVISEHADLPGIAAPVWHWTPSIAVCGIDFHPGTGFPAWKNNLFVTSLKFHQLRRLVIDDNAIVEDEIILKNIGRVRDVDIGPDGRVYLLTNAPGRILRLDREE